MLAQRTDLRGLLTFTIDPVSARDYDDAISIVQDRQNTVLYVHIADVAEYVKKGSKLFAEAVQRGNSYYFPRKVIPMLPTRLSNGVCSLRPDEDKLTMTVETHFSPSGAVVKQSVYESIIRSDARLTYEQVDDLFDTKTTEIAEDVAAALQQARQLSALLSEIRYKAGYLRFDLPESEYEFDDEGHLKAIHRSRETDSHRLIENFMLVANEYVCSRLSVAETMYRIHEQPDEQRIEAVLDVISKYNIDVYFQDDLNKTLQLALEELKTEAYHRVFDRQILRSLKRARYSIENKGHFGLAMNTYTHFTSPIRRLCDLVVHHQIKDMLHREPAQFTRKELFELAGRATEREMVADESEREVEWKSKRAFMRKKLGEEFSGIVVGVTPGKLLVELDPFPVVGVVDLGLVKREGFDYYEQYGRLVGRKTGMLIGLADPVKVMVSNVSDDIYFQLLL
jgi:ribonuclease R